MFDCFTYRSREQSGECEAKEFADRRRLGERSSELRCVLCDGKRSFQELVNTKWKLNSSSMAEKQNSLSFLKGYFNKYGSYLLSRILVQYHRP